MISKEFRDFLIAQDLSIGSRIYAGYIPNAATLPAVVFLPTLAEYGTVTTGSDGLAITTIKVEIVSEDLTEAEEVADEIRLALVNYSGDWGSYRIGYVTLEGMTGELIPDVDTDTYLFSLTQDFKIGHTVA